MPYNFDQNPNFNGQYQQYYHGQQPQFNSTYPQYNVPTPQYQPPPQQQYQPYQATPNQNISVVIPSRQHHPSSQAQTQVLPHNLHQPQGYQYQAQPLPSRVPPQHQSIPFYNTQAGPQYYQHHPQIQYQQRQQAQQHHQQSYQQSLQILQPENQPMSPPQPQLQQVPSSRHSAVATSLQPKHVTQVQPQFSQPFRQSNANRPQNTTPPASKAPLPSPAQLGSLSQYPSQPQSSSHRPTQPQATVQQPQPQTSVQKQPQAQNSKTIPSQRTPQIVVQIPTQQPPRVLQDVTPNMPRPPVSIKPEPHPEPSIPEVEPDYAVLLLSLADEYLDVANKMTERTESYYKLIATALGCIESVLANFKVPALREAQLSLRYSQILFDETENYDDAERVLTKAIDLCERNKYVDLKYAMQLLLARILYKSKPKAAIKDIQTMIEDIEAYKHTAWEYAFRFQYALFYLNAASVIDLHSAINQYEKLGNVARHNGDNAVLAFAAVIEAQLHLLSSASDAVTASQRALAKARALQLNSEVSNIPQLVLMMEFIDVCCSFREHSIVQYEQKRRNMQDTIWNCTESPLWHEDGVLQIPVAKRSLSSLQLQDGGLVTERSGKPCLSFFWMEKDDAEALAYLLSAITCAYKNSHDGGKAEKLVAEGLKIVHAALERGSSLRASSNDGRLARYKLLEYRLLVELAFLQCTQGNWMAAQQTIEKVMKIEVEDNSQLPKSATSVLQYLQAVVLQGTGKIDAALNIYQSSTLDLQRFQQGSKQIGSSAKSQDSEWDDLRSISILAAMNASLILHDPSHPLHNSLPLLLEKLDPLARSSSNKLISASYSLLLSVLAQSAILKSKKYLGEALNAAQSIGHAQITALTLAMMQEQLFRGQVGEQAVKCAKAASAQVRKWGEPMWIHVTSGMEAECYEVQGMKEEARKKKMDAEESLKTLPELVRKSIEPQK